MHHRASDGSSPAWALPATIHSEYESVGGGVTYRAGSQRARPTVCALDVNPSASTTYLIQ